MAFFYRRGTTKAYFLPAIAGSNPTSGEMSAGTDLSPQVLLITGFGFTNQRIQVPVLSSTFVSEINGPDQATASSLTFAEDNASTTIRTLLAKGTVGFILLAPNGIGTGKVAETWPIISSGVNRDWTLGNDPAKFVVELAVTSPPNQNVTLP